MIARGKRRVPGTMNQLEQAFAEELAARKAAGQIAWFKYEGITLKLADRCRFTPDFAVLHADGEMAMYEVKGGFFFEDAKVKLKVAAEMFPFRFHLATRKRKSDPWSVVEI